MINETTEHRDIRRTRALRLRRALAATVFLCVAAILITLIVHFAMVRRSASRQLAELKGTHADLQVLVDRIDWTTNQASADKRMVWNMLRQCREVEDVPDLQNEHLFSDHSNTEQMVMYVPAGDHDLEISAAWLPRKTTNLSMTAETKTPALAGERLWQIPITRSGGYLLQLKTAHQGGPIEWTLTGNHAEFSRQTGTVPLPEFRHSGASWSSSRVAQFPNQVSANWFMKPAGSTAKPPTAKLFAVQLFGSQFEQEYEVHIEIQLKSHTPACVTAADAQRLIITKRHDVLLPYRGAGKYEVRVDH
jgi:hypothetical protein